MKWLRYTNVRRLLQVQPWSQISPYYWLSILLPKSALGVRKYCSAAAAASFSTRLVQLIMANLRLSRPVLPQKSWWEPVSRSTCCWCRQAGVDIAFLPRNLKVKKESKSIWFLPVSFLIIKFSWDTWANHMTIMVSSTPGTMRWAPILVLRTSFHWLLNMLKIYAL